MISDALERMSHVQNNQPRNQNRQTSPVQIVVIAVVVLSRRNLSLLLIAKEQPIESSKGAGWNTYNSSSSNSGAKRKSNREHQRLQTRDEFSRNPWVVDAMTLA